MNEQGGALAGADLELILLDGSGRRFAISEGEELIVGAAAHCKVRLTAPDVSRRHALVARRHGRVVVMDLGSKNGTFIGGRKIAAEVELAAGETVKFSSVAAQVMPISSFSDGLAGDPADSRPGEVVTDQHSPTGDHADATLQRGLATLLGRWSETDGTAIAGLADWLIGTGAALGVAIVEPLPGELNVAAAAGAVVDVLPRLGEVVPALAEPQGPGGETVRVAVGSTQVLAVTRRGLPWLLILPSARMLDHAEIELLLRLTAVAWRLDRGAAAPPHALS